tara:strand:- start:873 stop:1160 length:288 start_codon:yes stop_codon:yes gene_type:complete
MTNQSKQWAITALETPEEQPTSADQHVEKLLLHWMRKYPQEKLKPFSDISGIHVEALVKEAVDEWIKAHANEYIAKHKAEQIALHEQALTELKNS